MTASTNKGESEMSKESIKQFLKNSAVIVLATVVLACVMYSIVEFAG